MSAELPDAVKNSIAFASGNTHPELGARVAELLGVEPVPVEFKRFADTEPYARYEESVRGKHVIAFQTHAPVDGYSVVDSFYQHLQMIDAAARSHARTIMAVAPNVAGARQDRQVLPRESVSAALNLGLLQNAGASDFVTVDIHDVGPLNAFRTPSSPDQLTAQPMLRAKLGELMIGNPDNYVLVSPDEGHSKVLRKHADILGVTLKDMVKDRDPNEEVVTHKDRVEGVEGRVCFIMDDLLGTAGTLVSAAENLHDSGSSEIYAAATHGWFSDPATERLKKSPIKRIYVTDTIPIRQDVKDELGDMLEVISAAEIIADGLKEILIYGSVSGLYGGENYS